MDMLSVSSEEPELIKPDRSGHEAKRSKADSRTGPGERTTSEPFQKNPFNLYRYIITKEKKQLHLQPAKPEQGEALEHDL